MANLERGIDLLPSRRKEVFILSRIQSLTYEDIAEHGRLHLNEIKERILSDPQTRALSQGADQDEVLPPGRRVKKTRK